MNKNICKIIILMLIINILIGMSPIVLSTGNTTIEISPENTEVTIGATFSIYLNTTIDSDDDIGGYEITFLNFTSGVINISKVLKGNVFDGYSSLWDGGTTYNISGYVADSYSAIIGVQSVSGAKSLAKYNILAYGVGVSPINFSVIMSYSETIFVHTDYYGNITVRPSSISGSTATTESHNNINLSWTTPFGSGVDKCVVFANHTGSAAGRDPGDEIYNGSESYYNHTGLSPDEQWNYSFWGYNTTAGLFSLLFQQDTATTDSAPIGGTWIMLGDPSPSNNTNFAYKTSQVVSIPIVAGAQTNIDNEAVTKGSAGGIDSLAHTRLHELLNVTQGGTDYTEGVDYTVDLYDGTINWSPAGAEPSTGTTYYVNYTYIHNTASSFEYWINTTAGQKTESGVSSGTKTYTMNALSGGREWWNVTAIYEGNKTQANFTFYINQKPTGGGGGGDWSEDPPNSAPSISISTALSVSVYDADGDSVNVTFYWQNTTRINNDTVVGSGTASVNPATLEYNTEYGWYVIADDGTDTTRGPTSGYWTFNTSTLGINLTKEWVLNDVNDTIRCWINVTNTGSTNFTNVQIWDRDIKYLNLLSYNHSGDFSSNGHLTWTIPYLNESGYENHYYNITMLYDLDTHPLAPNGTTFWNYANVSHLGLTSEQNISDFTLGFVSSKESNLSRVNDTILDICWWINITNTGDFNLTNVTVNETYFPYINYTSSNVAPVDSNNDSFNITYIKPGDTFSLIINVTITPHSISNGTRVYNNITIRSDQLSERSLSEYVSYGGYTERLRITYDTSLTDVSDYGNTLITIVGIILIISAILLVVGLLFRFGYFGKR